MERRLHTEFEVNFRLESRPDSRELNYSDTAMTSALNFSHINVKRYKIVEDGIFAINEKYPLLVILVHDHICITDYG